MKDDCHHEIEKPDTFRGRIAEIRAQTKNSHGKKDY